MKNGRRSLIVLLTLTGIYLFAFPSATIPYAAAVVLHAGGGVLLTLALGVALARDRAGLAPAVGWGLLGLGAVLGVALLFTGTLRPAWPLLYVHIVLSAAGVVVLAAEWGRGRGWLNRNRTALCGAFIVTVVAVSGLSWYLREVSWQQGNRIENPAMPPASMDDEGDGPDGHFFPSSAQTTDGKLIPAKFFMESQACERCHQEIYKQWFSSAHHFSSFNNQWYRKSIEYMQEVAGVEASKWCGGCHDPAVLFSGMMDTPIKDIVHTPEAQAGMGCMMCHTIVEVKSTMGQGDYVLEYPKLHELASAESPVVRALHDFMVRLNPEPHRRTFLKPFMREQTAEFCSVCHKVHLDVPVNSYRWIRGFNEYDNWQASGVSGQGARSFYYPAQSQMCADCHMPLTPADDDGNIEGFVHSHRFPAANTALPTANQDTEQMEAAKEFLQGAVSVDIFAVSPALPVEEEAPTAARAELATTFAVGEEAEGMGAPGVVREARAVTAPLDRVEAVVRRGDTVRVDVVVRTRRLGHFFPGGTVDAFDLWVELMAQDDKGQTVFWSGQVEDGGKGPVEEGAHFYRALLVDARGNPINKRNAWAARAVVYVRLIPPGAADTVHYRLRVPDNAGEEITLRAKVHYRKFAWWNTQFSFAGERDPKQPNPEVTPHYDDGHWVFTADTSRVSGELKEIPNLPILTLADDTVTLRVAPQSVGEAESATATDKEDWERWNDYGIGLLLQGDLKGAEAAFEKVTECDPQNPDGWVNIGRARVREGNLEGAREVLQRALTLSPQLARANFFYAMVLKEEGRYGEALEHLRTVAAQFPRDRVARNQMGRILFLDRKFEAAVEELQRVLAIDPEDLQAHFTLMLAYQGLGQTERAREHQKRYLRFKADEPAQAITGPYLRANPEDNKERQAIHEHGSVPLDGLPPGPPAYWMDGSEVGAAGGSR